MGPAHSLNVLFVQNNPELSRRFAAVCGQLPDCQVGCFQSKSPAEAIPYLDGGNFGIVVLDLTRNYGMGLGAVAELAMRAPEIPLVVVVDPGERDAGRDGVAAGAADWLPINAEVEVVNRCFFMCASESGFAKGCVECR
ncbi:MAG: hypothetical protein OHK005_19240 [Candidatus Methylacidiphilales bacterium]